METLEEFYRVEARRESPEIRFGSAWHSSKDPGAEFAVFWVVDTAELCVLRAPVRDVIPDSPFGFSRLVLGVPAHTTTQDFRDTELSIEVLGKIAKLKLDELMVDWEEHQTDANGIAWLRDVSKGSAADL